MTDRHGGGAYNAKVRAELGGDAAAARKVDELKQAWPRQVVKHCDTLLARPMPGATFDALARVMQWRSLRDVPAYLRPATSRRAKRSPIATVMADRSRGRATSRALWRLKQLHPDEFKALYQEERQKEQ